MRLNVRWRSGNSAYLILALLMPAAAAIGLALAWTSLGLELDNYAYDFLFRAEPEASWQPFSIILAIDEQTFAIYGYPLGLRAALADGLERIQSAHPAAVAVDTILSDPGDPAASARLEEAFSRTHNLVISADFCPTAVAGTHRRHASRSMPPRSARFMPRSIPRRHQPRLAARKNCRPPSGYGRCPSRPIAPPMARKFWNRRTI